MGHSPGAATELDMTERLHTHTRMQQSKATVKFRPPFKAILFYVSPGTFPFLFSSFFPTHTLLGRSKVKTITSILMLP